MRCWLTAWLLGMAAVLSFPAVAADGSVFDIQMLDAAGAGATTAAVTGGTLDSHFGPFDIRATLQRGGAFWLKLRSVGSFAPQNAVPALVVRKGRHLRVRAFALRDGKSTRLDAAVELSEFGGEQHAVFLLPGGLEAGEALYARIDALGRGAEELSFSLSTLDQALARGANHTRMIALAFGALMAMALAALLVWFVLSDRLFILYATLFSFQALYVGYFSGQAFDWPLLSYALPLTSYAWNVPAALTGAVACLFVREIADLRRFSRRVYNIFGWLAVLFVVLAFANLADLIGLGGPVAAAGNVFFVGSAVFTLVVAFMAWRRGNRAAGWFLIAWGLLEAMTIVTAASLLFADARSSDRLIYYGLPLSMVAAAVLVALGVADRLGEQRRALTEAERRAQIDPLTGVLNRRSLIERLDSACARARARDLPIALLFIDLDYFKEINDTYGHPAGDACLAAIIGPIQAELRQSDIVGRYGGEEFVVILSSAGVGAARPIAERIRARVAEVRVEGYGEPICLTCSIGVATSDTLGVWGEHLIARADAAVYAAKRSGRNRVQVAAPVAA